MKHHRLPDYAKRARRRFCKGDRCRTPADLVLSGKRTLEEWVAVLEEERARPPRGRRVRSEQPRDDSETFERNS